MHRHKHVALNPSLPKILSLHIYVYTMRNYSSGHSLSSLYGMRAGLNITYASVFAEFRTITARH